MHTFAGSETSTRMRIVACKYSPVLHFSSIRKKKRVPARHQHRDRRQESRFAPATLNEARTTLAVAADFVQTPPVPHPELPKKSDFIVCRQLPAATASENLAVWTAAMTNALPPSISGEAATHEWRQRLLATGRSRGAEMVQGRVICRLSATSRRRGALPAVELRDALVACSGAATPSAATAPPVEFWCEAVAHITLLPAGANVRDAREVRDALVGFGVAVTTADALEGWCTAITHISRAWPEMFATNAARDALLTSVAAATSTLAARAWCTLMTVQRSHSCAKTKSREMLGDRQVISPFFADHAESFA
jgi:hypothetical protein